MADFVGAIDQGTTSTRFMVFDHSGNEVGRHQLEHQQIMPRAGWLEHDPVEIWERTRTVVKWALADLRLQAADLAAVGVTNQRETAVVWDRRTGQPMCNAIVWQDTRTDPAGAASSATRRGFRPPRTSRVARSSGSWKTSTGFEMPLLAGTRSSARPTAGCCGTLRRRGRRSSRH